MRATHRRYGETAGAAFHGARFVTWRQAYDAAHAWARESRLVARRCRVLRRPDPAWPAWAMGSPGPWLVLSTNPSDAAFGAPYPERYGLPSHPGRQA